MGGVYSASNPGSYAPGQDPSEEYGYDYISNSLSTPGAGQGGDANNNEVIDRTNNEFGGAPLAPTNSDATMTAYNSLPAYTGVGQTGRGYYHPDTGKVDNVWDPNALPMDRQGIDKRLQGNLIDPYAGDYGGAPGVAESEEQRYAALADKARNGAAAQMNLGNYNADRGLELGSRGNQQTALSKYLDLANGTGPSLAQAQANYGIAQSNAQQASIAAGARGGGANLAAAQQAASNAAGSASANVIGQATMAREKEQMDALSAYGSMATAMRANDLQRQGLSEQQAAQQAAIEETQHQINSTAGLGYEGLRQNVFNSQQSGMEYNESENQNAYENGLGVGIQQHAQDSAQQGALIGAGGAVVGGLIGTIASPGAGTVAGASAGGSAGSAIGQTVKSQTMDPRAMFGQPGQTTVQRGLPQQPQVQRTLAQPAQGVQSQQQPGLSNYLRQPRMQQPTAPAPTLSPYVRTAGTAPAPTSTAPRGVMQSITSDVRNKRDIGDGAPAVRAQMGAMAPHAYQYRDPTMQGAGPGPRVGVMAQDMERGPYGHQLVKNTPQGKKIDGPGALSLALASGADHEQRLRELEARARSMPMGASPGDAASRARAAAYAAYMAERQQAPGYAAAQAAQQRYEQQQQNAPAFRSFAPESAISLPSAPPQYPTAPPSLDTNPQPQQPLAMYLRPQNGGQ